VKPARERVRPIIRRLKRQYPEAKCSLDYYTPLELLVATILSAQCTDERVNLVTPVVFARYRTARDYAEANPEELETIIKSTGFYRNKTKSLIGMGRALVERHGGEVPRTLAELTTVPGVGRKTANVVLGNAFGLDEGVVVDTHVSRLSQRLGLTRQTDAGKIERDLMTLIPRKEWTLFPHLMIHHGRTICQARKPRCEICPVNDLCPFPDKAVMGGRRRSKAVKGGRKR
jgi:endonuclease-3